MIIRNAQRLRYFIPKSVVQALMSISNVNTTQYSGIATGSINISYDFVHSLGYLENNAPPQLDSVDISGEILINSVLTASAEGYFSRSGYPSGSHIYRWYRATSKQNPSENIIQENTSSYYTLQSSDLYKYIRVGVIPVQIGGLNYTGSEVASIYTTLLTSSNNPTITDLNWDKAFLQNNTTTYAITNVWPNRGTKGADAVTSSINGIPTFSIPSQSIYFNRQSGSFLNFDNPNPQILQPYEYWVRFKTTTSSLQQYVIGLSNSIYFRIQSTNSASANTTDLTVTTPLNEWNVIRVYTHNSSSFIQLNSGSEIPFTSSTNAVGTGTTRIGSSVTPTGSYFEGFISDVLIKDTPLSGSEVDKVWRYFGYGQSEFVQWTDLNKLTIVGSGSLNTDTSSGVINISSPASAISSQIIPFLSDGYLTWTWDPVSNYEVPNGPFLGIIKASDTITFNNIELGLIVSEYSLSTYERGSYQAAGFFSGGDCPGTGYTYHRIRVERSNGKIYWDHSNNSGSTWIQKYTSSISTSGDLRAIFYTDDSGSGIRNVKIYANDGLI